MFQSPRSGKFVSDDGFKAVKFLGEDARFQSPRSGKFISNLASIDAPEKKQDLFQSPRSGEFVSNMRVRLIITAWLLSSFNPLDRGNLYLI